MQTLDTSLELPVAAETLELHKICSSPEPRARRRRSGGGSSLLVGDEVDDGRELADDQRLLQEDVVEHLERKSIV